MIKMKKIYFSLVFVVFACSAFSQDVGINQSDGDRRIIMGLGKEKGGFCVWDYELNRKKLVGFVSLFGAGFVDGALERWEFGGRRGFENAYGVDEFGFWGSRSYERRFTDPDLWNKTFGVFDFYHVADDLRKGGYVFGGVMIVIGGKKDKSERGWRRYKYHIFDFLLGLGISGLGKRLGDRWMYRLNGL